MDEAHRLYIPSSDNTKPSTIREVDQNSLGQDQKFDIVIVGGGQAGAQTACALRAAKFEGSIALVGEESEPPYERPPLSKDYLLGEKSRERLYLRTDNFWQDQNIELILGERVVSMDAPSQYITTTSGKNIAYGLLVWATGGTPRQIPLAGVPEEHIFTIRTLMDIDRLQEKLEDAQNVAIIGGGYIGLEAAAVLRKLGRGVDLIELAPRVLSRVAAPELSQFFERVHQAHGVRLHLGTKVQHTEPGDRLTLHLDNGERVTCDLVIVGVGIDPNVAPLEEAGAIIDNGVAVDEFCQTSLPHIYGIGDCVSFKSAFADGAQVRLESVQNANDQAKIVAHHIMGRHKPYTALPWFWSDQYDLKLQTIGLNHGYTDTLLRGDPETNSFSLLYFRGKNLCAIDSVNRPLDFAQGRILLGKPLDRDDPALKNVDVPLKSFMG